MRLRSFAWLALFFAILEVLDANELFLFPQNNGIPAPGALPKLVAQSLETLENDSGCWKQIQHQVLPVQCQSLEYEQRGRLSIALTECYLRESGISIPSCPESRELKSCTEAISHHSAGFATYTAFFTSADAICHHFQHSSFAEAVERSIRQLLEASLRTKESLDQMESDTASASTQVLLHLSEIQESAVHHSSELRNHSGLVLQTLENQQSMIQSQAALEHQQKLLYRSMQSFGEEFDGLFERLSQLQGQARQAEAQIGQISGDIGRLMSLQQSTLRAVLRITSSAFYIIVFLMSLLLPMLWKRARGARVAVVAEILLFVGLERTWMSLAPLEAVVEGGGVPDPQDQEAVVARLRQIFLLVALVTTLVAAYRYEDASTRLLYQIRRNGQLLKRLVRHLEGRSPRVIASTSILDADSDSDEELLELTRHQKAPRRGSEKRQQVEGADASTSPVDSQTWVETRRGKSPPVSGSSKRTQQALLSLNVPQQQVEGVPRGI